MDRKETVEIVIYKDEWDSLDQSQRDYIVAAMAVNFGLENLKYEGQEDEG